MSIQNELGAWADLPPDALLHDAVVVTEHVAVTEASTRELEAVVAEMKGWSGKAVDELRARVLGMIGANHFDDGRIDQAREMTRQALEASAEVGDEQLVSAYRQNLHLFETALTKAEPRPKRKHGNIPL